GIRNPVTAHSEGPNALQASASVGILVKSRGVALNKKTQVIHLQANCQITRDKENGLAENVHNLNTPLRNALRRDSEDLKVAEIGLQIRWHQAFDPLVPRAKDVPTKKEGKLLIFNKQWQGTSTGPRNQMVLKRRLVMSVIQAQGSQI
ncbi:hypothetical protein PAXRUDRAFT_377677, partial [Paxillus rubicundulus Ve08.2h10]